MRKIILRTLGTALSFYVTSYLVAGFQLSQSWQTYLLASFIFVIFNWIASPIIKLLLLPINLLTLGLFRWIANVIVLYIFDLFYNGLTISAYSYPGYTSSLISIPSLHLSLFWVLVISSFLISLSFSIFSSLLSSE